ncbi:MAG: hypothetical protein O3B65_06415 [Chloroflexi bacterium]|nr:hypothetical protein [Chloroflexota bacterium]
MIELGLYVIALTFVGMAVELFRLANAPTSLDLRLRADGMVLDYEARTLAKLRVRRIAARLSGLVVLIVGGILASVATSSWL